MLRFDIINHFIQKNNFKDYLEIGVFRGECIRLIKCENKDGVDPGAEQEMVPEVNYRMTSDEFFSKIDPDKKYEIVFIDGLHDSRQVDKDIKNALNHTTDNGVIILHDCNPPTEKHSLVPRPKNAHEWNGDVYKSMLRFQDENTQHNYFTVDTDWGVGVILKNNAPTSKLSSDDYRKGIKKWKFFDAHRKELLNLISEAAFSAKY